jgi:hypothetical protein
MTISNVYLYGETSTENEFMEAKAYLEKAKIKFKELFYRDENQIGDVLSSIETWFPDRRIEKFPFLVWDQEIDGSNQRAVLVDVKSIKTFKGKPIVQSVETPKN